MAITKKQKYITCVVGLLIVSTLFSSTAHAYVIPLIGGFFGDASKATSGASSPIYCYSFFPPSLSVSGCIMMALASLGYSVLYMVSWVLWVTGKFFNMALSIQNQAFHAPNNAMVEAGWTIARDVANIFYIIFLLIIAIGTILRLDSYNYKSLLPKLIISALLVNFSLVLTSVIIDLSNVLGNTFYIHMTVMDATGTRDVSAVLLRGFAPQSIYELGNQDPAPAASDWDTMLNIIISVGGGIAVILTTAFVLIAATVLLLVRIISLWIIMILSPLAVLFMALPQTREYTSQWFRALFSQAFFYPSFMFLLYLVVILISKKTHLQMMGITNTPSTDIFTGKGGSTLVQQPTLILAFNFLIILVLSTLVVAKKMGAYGAGMAEKAAKYTRRQSARPFYAAGRGMNRLAERSGLYQAGTKAAAQASRIPLVPGAVSGAIGRAAARPFIAGTRKAEADRKAQATAQANLAKDLPAASAALFARTLNAKGKAQLWDNLKDDKKKEAFIEEMGKSDSVAFAKAIHTSDPSKKYDEQVAKASGDIATALKITRDIDEPGEKATSEERAGYQREVDNFLVRLPDKEKREFMKPDVVRENKNIQQHIINNFSISDVGRIAEPGDRAKAFGELLDTAMANGTLAARNKKLYDRLLTAPGGVMLITRLKEGSILRPSDYGKEKRRQEKGDKDKPAEEKSGPSIITPSEGFGGGARTQEEQEERERIRRDLEEKK